MADLLKDRIAHRIKELRTSAKMTQEETARATGVSTRHYVRWEQGHALPYWRNIEKLAEVFQVPSGVIVDAENPGAPQDPQRQIAMLTRELAALQQQVGDVPDLKQQAAELEALRQKVDQLTRLLGQQDGENPQDEA